MAVSQEEKRRQILDAAVRAFARKGYHACRVGEIAEEAGVAYGLVYHYFKSKEEVLQTIFRDTWTLMLARIAEMEADGEPASEQVRKVTALLLRTWKRDPDLVRVLVREVTRSPEQLLTGWIFEVLPRTDEEFERSKSLVVEAICEGLQSARPGAPAVSG